jgi:P pilus assembly chaperone PapD
MVTPRMASLNIAPTSCGNDMGRLDGTSRARWSRAEAAHAAQMDLREPLHGRGRLLTRWLGSALDVVLTTGLLATLASSGLAWAGVTPEVSRVVFPAKSVEQSLQVFNVNKYPVVVQAWVDNGDVTKVPQQSKAPVIVLPPIFRMGPGDQANLRLINAGEPLPGDRESVFWLNLYEIPATPKAASVDGRTVTVTMRTQIKVFVRPDALPCSPGDIPEHLGFSVAQAGGKLVLDIENPTPYYATIGVVRVAIRGASQQATPDMLAPFSRETLTLDMLHGNAGENAKLQFTVIGDDGNRVLNDRSLVVGLSDGS